MLKDNVEMLKDDQEFVEDDLQVLEDYSEMPRKIQKDKIKEFLATLYRSHIVIVRTRSDFVCATGGVFKLTLLCGVAMGVWDHTR
jgi:hypothetical protein